MTDSRSLRGCLLQATSGWKWLLHNVTNSEKRYCDHSPLVAAMSGFQELWGIQEDRAETIVAVNTPTATLDECICARCRLCTKCGAVFARGHNPKLQPNPMFQCALRHAKSKEAPGDFDVAMHGISNFDVAMHGISNATPDGEEEHRTQPRDE